MFFVFWTLTLKSSSNYVLAWFFSFFSKHVSHMVECTYHCDHTSLIEGKDNPFGWGRKLPELSLSHKIRKMRNLSGLKPGSCSQHVKASWGKILVLRFLSMLCHQCMSWTGYCSWWADGAWHLFLSLFMCSTASWKHINLISDNKQLMQKRKHVSRGLLAQ